MKLSDRQVRLVLWCVNSMASMHEPEIEKTSGFRASELDRLGELLRTEIFCRTGRRTHSVARKAKGEP